MNILVNIFLDQVCPKCSIFSVHFPKVTGGPGGISPRPPEPFKSIMNHTIIFASCGEEWQEVYSGKCVLQLQLHKK